jgi:hypothetical protein
VSTAEHKENSALSGVGGTPDAWFDDAARAFEAAAERVRASWDDVDLESKDEGLLPPEPWLPAASSAAAPFAQPSPAAPQVAPAFPAPSPTFPQASPAFAPAAQAADVIGKHAPVTEPFSDFARLPTQRTEPSVAARFQAFSRENRWLVPALGLTGALLLVLAWPRSEPAPEQSEAPNAPVVVEAAPQAPVSTTPSVEAVPAAAAPRRETEPSVEPVRPRQPPAAAPLEAARERAPEPRKLERPALRESRSQRAGVEPASRKRPVRESAPTRPSRSRIKSEPTAVSAAPVDRPKEAPKPRKGTGFVSANPY